MDEIDYGELFGVEGSENTQEAAEPVTDAQEEPQGEREPEFAEPAQEQQKQSDQAQEQQQGDQVQEAGGDESGEETALGKQPPEKKKQSAEENARNAAARRKAERDRAIAQERRKAQEQANKQVAEAFQAMGLRNPYTGQPVTNMEELQAYKKRYAQERRQQLQKKSGLSEDEFSKWLADLPEVQQAQMAKQEAERVSQEAKQTAAKAQIEDQIAEIGKLNPEIKQLGDLAKQAYYPEFYKLVKMGYSLVDAYKVTNFDVLIKSAAAAAEQKARNSAAGKSHLGRTTSRGAGAVTVPLEVREMYRVFNPAATDAEIQAHYSRFHKK